MTKPRAVLFALLLIVVGFCSSVDVHHSTPYLFADEAVYHAMSLSLAYNYNLKYDLEDLNLIYRFFPAGPRGIILKQSRDEKISYAKPFLYPLICAPLYRIFHLNSFLLINGFAWWLTLYILFTVWGRNWQSLIFAFICLSFSAFIPYVLWIHPEILTAFLVALFCGLWRLFETKQLKPKYQKYTPEFMGITLACIAGLKLPLVIIGLAPLLDWLGSLKIRTILRGIAAFSIVLIIITSTNFFATGSINPYSGQRKIFNDHYPLLHEGQNFQESGNSWSTETAKFYFVPEVFLANLDFFFVGRFSGLLWYFTPVIFVLISWLFGNRDRIGNRLLPICLLLIVTQLVMIPTNYHGGGGALGNRYFVVMFPALLLCIPKPPGKRMLIMTAIFSGIFSGPFLMQSFSASYRPGLHTLNKPYSFFPCEWTLTGSFPLFDPRYRRVQFDNFDGYCYFLDHHSYGKEGNGFWVKGDQTTEILLETPLAPKRFLFHAGNSFSPIDGLIDFTGGSFQFHLDPMETKLLVFPAGRGHRMINIYGQEKWIHKLKLTISGGAIPKFSQAGGDSRYLGAFITPFNYEK